MPHLRPLVAALAAAAVAQAATINHIVVLQFENRAFDHLLGWLTRNNSDIRGLTGTEYNLVDPSNPNSQRVYVGDRAAYVTPDPGHSVPDTAQQVYGPQFYISNLTKYGTPTMSGFVANAVNNTGASWSPQIMECWAPEDIPVISTLAMQFALFDNFFAAIPGPTFVNRLFTQSATSWGYGDNDVLQTILGWPQKSVFTALEEVNVSWRVYFEEVSTSWLLADQREVDDFENCRWIDQFATDVAAGDLPEFTWLDPSYFSVAGIVNSSDMHPGHDLLDGERRLKVVYEALRASPLWNDTVLIITMDEHGGNFDAVPPPTTGVPNPDGRPCVDCDGISYNFDRLGVRIPTIVVSPWVAAGTVIHSAPAAVMPTPSSQFELSSIPATLHSVYGTKGFLTARDAWAIPLDWVWENSTLTQPRTDCPMTLPPVPAQSPGMVGVVQGAAPLTALQKELLYLVQGTFGGAVSRAHADGMTAAAGIVTEHDAGLYIRELVAARIPPPAPAA